jgi:hypothetical protein
LAESAGVASNNNNNNTNNAVSENNNNNNITKQESAAALGVSWLPLGLLPEKHRFLLRQCGADRIFEVDYAPLLVQSHLVIDDKSKKKGATTSGGGGFNAKDSDQKRHQLEEAEKRRKRREAAEAGVAYVEDDSNNNKTSNSNPDQQQHHEDEEDLLDSTMSFEELERLRHEQVQRLMMEEQSRKVSNDPADYFDVDSEQFDNMWWSRDDVTGGGGAAIVRPLQMAYLLPPQPIRTETCSRDIQCEIFSSASPPRSRPGSPSEETAKALNFDETAEATGNDIEKVAAALENAISGRTARTPGSTLRQTSRAGGRTPSATVTSAAAAAAAAALGSPNINGTTTTRLGATNSASSATRGRSAAAAGGARSTSNNNNSKKKKKKKQEPVEIEVKIPPVMVERGEQTMTDLNYDHYLYFEQVENRKDAEDEKKNGFASFFSAKKLVSTNNYNDQSGMLSDDNNNTVQDELLIQGPNAAAIGGHDSLNDDAAASVVDICVLMEHFVNFLSGTGDFKELLSAISQFVGPLHRLIGDDHHHHHHHHYLQQQPDGDSSPDGTLTAQEVENREQLTWDRLADALLEHLLARLTFPVPPSQTTTFRLVVGGMLACVAEFVRSVPDLEAEATKERFKNVFSFSSWLQLQRELVGETSSTNETSAKPFSWDNNNNNNNAGELQQVSNVVNDEETVRENILAEKKELIIKKKVNPVFRALSVAMAIAQNIRLAPLDDADNVAAAHAHASAMHQKIRRRSQANSSTQNQRTHRQQQQQQTSGGGNYSMRQSTRSTTTSM